MWSDPWLKLIAAIHTRTQPVVLVTTGGGACAISEILSVPGASRTVLDAQVPYSSAALIQWLGRRPDQFCDERTALAMASVAAARGQQLVSQSQLPTAASWGISCTAALASDRPKRGDHRCFVAVQSPQFTTSYALILEKGARTRAAEDQLVGQIIVHALASGLGIENLPELPLRSSEHIQIAHQVADARLAAVWSGSDGCVWSNPDGSLATTPAVRPRGLLCGAFDPLHRAHQELRSVAEKQLGGPVAYEISITNVDKPPLDFLTIERRRRQFTQEPLALTNAPRYWQKAQLFPQTVFVIGADTALRIIDPRYYGGDVLLLEQALQSIRETGCRFLVAPRLIDERLVTLSGLSLPGSAQDLFTEIAEADFRVDLSSTQLRQQGRPDE